MFGYPPPAFSVAIDEVLRGLWRGRRWIACGQSAEYALGGVLAALPSEGSYAARSKNARATLDVLGNVGCPASNTRPFRNAMGIARLLPGRHVVGHAVDDYVKRCQRTKFFVEVNT
jgi:hypothetical protein